jgi:hypothetical protein
MNVGDVILYNRLECVFNVTMEMKNTWYHRLAFGEITPLEIFLINKYAKIIIVGGHGLLMPSSNENGNSGWGFNIKIKNIGKIKTPIAFFAIGYNIFRGKNNFIPIFRKHITKCLEKSLFFGLRNYGSINAIKEYLPEYLYSKISYQPCTTTMTSIYSNENDVLKTKTANEIAVSIAFNQFKNRFGDNYQSIFEQLMEYCHTMEQNGFKIILCGHHVLDVYNKHAKYFKLHGFSIRSLYKYSENTVCEFYKSKKLVISMRGHGLMIPFGLNVPILSLTTQDKQKWFIETTGHGEWNIELTNNLYRNLLDNTLKILDNYEYIRNEIMKIQKINKEITDRNIHYIENNIQL